MAASAITRTRTAGSEEDEAARLILVWTVQQPQQL
jgi:hypothetical protein